MKARTTENGHTSCSLVGLTVTAGAGASGSCRTCCSTTTWSDCGNKLVSRRSPPTCIHSVSKVLQLLALAVAHCLQEPDLNSTSSLGDAAAACHPIRVPRQAGSLPLWRLPRAAVAQLGNGIEAHESVCDGGSLLSARTNTLSLK